MDNIVEYWDWREHQVLPDDPPEQRGGSCYLYSALGALEANLQMRLISEKPSLQEPLDCCLCTGDLKGGNVIEVLKRIKEHGITTDAEYPLSDEHQGRCRRCHEKLFPKVRIQEVCDVEDMSERGLMDAVRKRPVVVSFTCGIQYCAYKKEDKVTRLGLNPSKDENLISHSAIVLGYGTEEGENGGPYWILRNSWGGIWGDRGCMKMHRDFTKMFEYAVYPEGAFIMDRDLFLQGAYPMRDGVYVPIEIAQRWHKDV